MPLPTFTLESNQIKGISGTYQQGHIFNLTRGLIKKGNSLRLRVSDNDRFDLGDMSYDDATLTWTDVIPSEDEQDQFLDFIFISPPPSFNFPVSVWDNTVNDYVLLFTIIEQ